MTVMINSQRPRKGPRGGVTMPFPEKLHEVLSDDKYSDIISWQPHGRCFLLHKPQEFLQSIMHKHFRQSKLTSFQRQLNLYGFCRITTGPDKGSYYHELFLRGKPSLCAGMIRVRVKGTGNRSSPSQEVPNFYAMPPIEPDDIGDMDLCMSWKGSNQAPVKQTVHADSSLVGRSSMVSVTSTDSFANSDSEAPEDRPYLPTPIISQRKRTNATRSPKLLGVSISVPVSPPMESQSSTSEMESLDLGEANHTPVQDELVMFEGKSFYYIESRSTLEKSEISNVGRCRSVTFDEDSIFSASKKWGSAGYPVPESTEDLAESADISPECFLINLHSFPHTL